MVKPIAENSSELNAEFSVEENSGSLSVILEGRWHRTHNRDYLPALDLLLVRLRELQASVSDILVDTAYTRRHKLTESVRRLPVRGRRYPLVLRNETDIPELRMAILSRIGSAGLLPGAKGGHTPLKRIRLVVEIPNSALPTGNQRGLLEDYLRLGTLVRR
jgi:hypothetical protein